MIETPTHLRIHPRDATAPAVEEIVEATLHPLRAGCESADEARLDVVSADLGRLDGFALAAHLDAPSRTQYRFDFGIVPMLLAAGLGAEALRAAGFRLAGRDALLATLRHRANAARPFHALHATARWLVPASGGDRPLLQVAALALTAKGMPHKPWSWEGSPDHGHFSLLRLVDDAHQLPLRSGLTRVVVAEDLLPHPRARCRSAS